MPVVSMPCKTLQYGMRCNYVNQQLGLDSVQCKHSPQFIPTLPTVQIQHAAHSYIIYNANTAHSTLFDWVHFCQTEAIFLVCMKNNAPSILCVPFC